MRIKFGTVWLTGDSPKEWPDGLRIVPGRDAEPKKGLRFTQVEMADRGNESWTYQFRVTRQHAGVRECQRYMHDHVLSLSGRAHVTFVFTDGSGEDVYWLANAICRAVPTQVGVRSICSYTLTGGRPTKDNPA